MSTNIQQEDLTHNTNKLLKKIKSIPITQQPESNFKPEGFWYSCNDEWLKWVRVQMPKWEGKRNYKIELDYTNIITIRNYTQLKAFHKKYAAPMYSGDPLNGYINWREVANAYKGIEICPYLYKARFDREIRWYYSWDVASGCIWDASAVKSIELMAPIKKQKPKSLKERRKLNFGLSSPKPLSASAKRKKMKKDMGMVDLKTLVEEIVKLVLEQQQHVIS